MTRVSPQNGRCLGWLLPTAGGLLLMSGCASLTGNRTPTPPPQVTLNQETPAPEQLVSYLNKNADKVTALESRQLDIDAHADGRTFGLKGSLHCQKPKNFRMRAKAVGVEQADFGSNDQEFWFWVKHNEPPHLYHCSYTDLERGVRMPFPLQPEWVLEALGMATRDPNGRYEVRRRERDRYLDLIERTQSPQGQPVVKITSLNNFTANGTTPQVVGHYLYEVRNDKNHLICSATVIDVQYDASTQTVVPHKVKLEWPDQKMAMTLTLGDIAVNRPRPDLPALFQRPTMTGVRSVDLARASNDSGPTSIRRAGGSGQ
jgi:hypothetical protein